MSKTTTRHCQLKSSKQLHYCATNRCSLKCLQLACA